MSYLKDSLFLLGSLVLAVVLGLAVAVCLGGCATVLQATPERALISRVAFSSVTLIDENGGVGSGTVVKVGRDRALVLTAAHVVEGTRSLDVSSVRAHGQGKVLKVDRAEDLALVEVDADLKVPPLPIAKREPRRYDLAWLVGAFDGYPRTAGAGRVVSTKYAEPNMPSAKHGLFLIAMPVYLGDSGGTVANGYGELEGVPVLVPAETVDVTANTAIGIVATPLAATVAVPNFAKVVGVWAIRDFLKGTEVSP